VRDKKYEVALEVGAEKPNLNYLPEKGKFLVECKENWREFSCMYVLHLMPNYFCSDVDRVLFMPEIEWIIGGGFWEKTKNKIRFHGESITYGAVPKQVLESFRERLLSTISGLADTIADVPEIPEFNPYRFGEFQLGLENFAEQTPPILIYTIPLEDYAGKFNRLGIPIDWFGAQKFKQRIKRQIKPTADKKDLQRLLKEEFTKYANYIGRRFSIKPEPLQQIINDVLQSVSISQRNMAECMDELLQKTEQKLLTEGDLWVYIFNVGEYEGPYWRFKLLYPLTKRQIIPSLGVRFSTLIARGDCEFDFKQRAFRPHIYFENFENYRCTNIIPEKVLSNFKELWEKQLKHNPKLRDATVEMKRLRKKPGYCYYELTHLLRR